SHPSVGLHTTPTLDLDSLDCSSHRGLRSPIKITVFCARSIVGAGKGTSAASRPRHTGHAIARRAIKGVHRIYICRHQTPRHREAVVSRVVRERTDGV